MNEIILTSSVLILIIAALRHVLRGRISPTLQYALWLLVAARLLIPGTLFTAPVTIVGLAEDIHSAVIESITDETPPMAEVLPPSDFSNQTITLPVTPLPGWDSDTVTSPAPDSAPTPAPVKPSIDIDWLDVLWKTGILIVGTAFIASNFAFYRKLRRERQRIPADELPVPCSVPVYYVHDLASPCLFGFRSAIYINQAALPPQRLRYVLTHELTHRRHGDHFWAILRCACLAIHWYNPLVWWAATLSRRDCELSCDSAVLNRLGESSGIRYGETLMEMLTAAPASILHTATTMSACRRTMTERLKLIVHRPRMMKLTLAVVALIATGAVILTFGGCGDAVNHTPDSDTDITDSDIPAVENTGDSSDSQPNEDDKPTPPPDGFGYIPSYVPYAHPSKLFSMNLPHGWEEAAVTVETEDGISFYEADQYQTNSENGWILSVHPQPADWSGITNPFVTLAAFDSNGTPQNFILEYSSEYAEAFALLRQILAESFTPLATAEQFSRLIHDSFESNIALAISYLPYLSWTNYREVYGEDALMPLLSALWQFADSGTADWGQYHDILSTATAGLDGAYSEGLASIFEALFIRNHERFYSVINSVYITDAERERVNAYINYALGITPDEDSGNNNSAPDKDNETDPPAPDEDYDQELAAQDTQVIMGLARGYGPSVWGIGSPAELTLTLTADWTLEGIKTALFAALSEHLSGTLLEGDLREIEISYAFRFPEQMHDGVILTVPYHAIYVDQDVHTLPSGATHSPSGRTGELTASITLVGEGITAPADEEFARGQTIYDMLAQIATIEEGIFVSLQTQEFTLLSEIHRLIDQHLADAGLTEQVRITSASCGQHYNPVWCDPGYEQIVDYSVTFQYTEGEKQYQYSFNRTVLLTTVS